MMNTYSFLQLACNHHISK